MKANIIGFNEITQRENVIYSKLHFIFVFIGMFIAVPIITLLLVVILDFLVVYPLYYLAQLFS